MSWVPQRCDTDERQNMLHSLSISTTLETPHPALVRAFADLIGMTSLLAHVESVMLPDGSRVATVEAEGSFVDLQNIGERWSMFGRYPGAYTTPMVLVPTMGGEVMN